MLHYYKITGALHTHSHRRRHLIPEGTHTHYQTAPEQIAHNEYGLMCVP